MTARLSWSASRWWLALVLALQAPSGAQADEVVLRSGRRHEGHPIRRGDEIHLNEYGCSVPAMTRGVRRLRVLDVEKIVPKPFVDHLHRRLLELGPDDVARRVDLLREAQSERERDWVQRIAAEILRVDPDHREALDAVRGAERWQEMRRGDPRLDRDLAAAIRQLIRLESGAARRERARELHRTHGWAGGVDVVERMVRCLRRPRGLLEDQPLRMEADEFVGATYTLYVPPDLDPLVPRPLLVALHGGGIMQEKGERTRGSARDAVALYLEDAKRLGWLLVCPAAVEAPWPTSENMRFLDAVLEEVLTLYNVDTARLHVAGQGGGGDGAWDWARRRRDDLASVSVASAGDPGGVSLIAGRTAVWIYHGEANEILPVEPVREAADRLLRRGSDFVYCELPREPHGFAPAARRDMFRYILPKRRRRARTAWPVPSFHVPSSRSARETFGDPALAWGIGLPEDADPPALAEILARGRPDAEHAARRLASRPHEELGEVPARVREVVHDREAPREARVWGAWLLGRWRDPQAVGPLGDVLRAGRDPRLLRHAADAVARIGSADSTQDLRWALADVSKRWRSISGDTVTWRDLERTARLGAAVVGALGRCAPPDTPGLLAEIEENLVRHVLMDRRPVRATPAHGESVATQHGDLVRAVALAYRRLRAERTLFDMLRIAARRHPASLQAFREAMQKPLR